MEIDPLSTDIDWLSLKCADFQVNVLVFKSACAAWYSGSCNEREGEELREEEDFGDRLWKELYPVPK